MKLNHVLCVTTNLKNVSEFGQPEAVPGEQSGGAGDGPEPECGGAEPGPGEDAGHQEQVSAQHRPARTHAPGGDHGQQRRALFSTGPTL